MTADRLAQALSALLNDTQHAEHNCNDDQCPVREAREALAEHRAQCAAEAHDLAEALTTELFDLGSNGPNDKCGRLQFMLGQYDVNERPGGGLGREAFKRFASRVIAAHVQPKHPADGDEQVTRLIHAVEGECHGLAITKDQAVAILSYVCPADAALQSPAPAPESAREALKRGALVEAVARAIAFADSGSTEDWEGCSDLADAAIRVCDARNPPRCSYCHASTSQPAQSPAVAHEKTFDEIAATERANRLGAMASAIRPREDEDARDAARYRALRDWKFSFSPQIVDPTNSWLTYTPEGLDKVCDAMIDIGGPHDAPKSDVPVQGSEQ